MKKKLAAFLCGVMCVGTFAGCSDTELAYLKMSSDLLDTMSACKVEGTMQADVDFDALQDFIADVAKTTGGETYPAMYNGEELSGKKAVTVDYDMNMNMEMLAYDMAFDVTYEGKKYDLGTMYYSMMDGVYVTTDTLWGVYQMAGELAEGYEDSYVFSDAFAKDLKAILAEDEYVELVSMEYLTGVNMESAMPKGGMGDLYDAVYTFYEDVLDGFETGMVKEISGGYKIEADGRAVAQLMVDLLKFVAENPDQIIDATEAYMTAVMDSTASNEEEKAMIQQAFAEMRASQDDFVAAAGQFAVILEDMMSDVSVGMMLDTFNYEATAKKTGNGFDSTAEYDVTHKGKTIFNLVTDAKMVKSAVNVSFPVNGMTIEELEDKLAVLENEKYNPVTGVSISWGWGGESEYADLHTLRSVAEGVFFNNDYNWTEMVIKDGRAYLPLRMIGEILGEEVGWDNTAKTAYVVQDGQQVEMKGLLQDNRTFVGVRDFEKLGYTVTYTAYEDGFKEAVIEK